MRQLGIVVPALGTVERLEQTLVSVLEHRPDNCEVVVALGIPYADPYGLEGDVTFVHAPPESGWIGAANRGIEAADAEIVHLISCGSEVSADWTRPAIAAFDDERIGAVSPVVICADDGSGIAGVRYRPGGARLVCEAQVTNLSTPATPRRVLGPTWHAGFYRRGALDLLDELFSPIVGEELADVDLALRLGAAGYRCAFESRSVVRGYAEPCETCRSAFAQGLHAERLFRRSAPHVGWTGELLSHALLLARDVACCVLRPAHAMKLAGRASAWFESAGSMAANRDMPQSGSPARDSRQQPQSDLRVTGASRPRLGSRRPATSSALGS